MEIYNVRSLDTFSSEVQSRKGAKRREALLSEQASCMWVLGCTTLKLFSESTVALYTTLPILKPEIGHQSSQLCYLSEQFWSFLKTEDNSIELKLQGQTRNVPQAGRSRTTRASNAKSGPSKASRWAPFAPAPEVTSLLPSHWSRPHYLQMNIYWEISCALDKVPQSGLKMKTKFTVKNSVRGWHTQASP